MRKLLASAIVLFSAANASANDFLCSYTAEISDHNKYNSSGMPLASGYNKTSVAAILRQDRADYYAFGVRDKLDTSDCLMYSKQQRANFERILNHKNTQMDSNFIRAVVDGNPIVDISLYRGGYIHAHVRSW